MEWKPTKESYQTYHTQIVNWFTERIACGDFPIGMKCPSQRALAVQFDVNRSTINTAMEELKANGLLLALVHLLPKILGLICFLSQNGSSKLTPVSISQTSKPFN